MAPEVLPVPGYGGAALADLTPSVLAALGVPDTPNLLGIEPLRRACVLLVDGLGWELLRQAPAEAPFLHGLSERGRPLSAGFPSTTAAGVAAIGTGCPPGEHGIVGYQLGVPGYDRPVNMLSWALAGLGPAVDLLPNLPPEQFQPRPTVFERAAAAGVPATVVAPLNQACSGLTRAVLRGAAFVAAVGQGDLVAQVASAFERTERALVYAYIGDLDAVGHVRGPLSEAWRIQLTQLDRLISALADRLPPDAALVVTADHGMVEVATDQRIDVERLPELRNGVRLLGGEPRARHIYTQPGAAPNVLATWQALVGDRMWILSRDQAIDAGLFGPRVDQQVQMRIGDVVAAARGPAAVVQPTAEPHLSAWPGQHGSLTPAEQLVPFLLVSASHPG